MIPSVRPQRPLGVLAWVVAVASLTAGAQGVAAFWQSLQQAPTFRVEAGLVEVIVRVTDEAGRFVPGLTAADFDLRDQGQPQTIVAFHSTRHSAESAALAGSPRPDVAAPDMSTVARNDIADTGGLFVLLLDDC